MKNSFPFYFTEKNILMIINMSINIFLLCPNLAFAFWYASVYMAVNMYLMIATLGIEVKHKLFIDFILAFINKLCMYMRVNFKAILSSFLINENIKLNGFLQFGSNEITQFRATLCISHNVRILSASSI